MALLELTDISKSFGGVQALRNVDFTLNAGEIHGLAGENGAGKSTMMKIISGVHSADSGAMRVDGKEVHFRSSRDALAASIGMVPPAWQKMNRMSGNRESVPFTSRLVIARVVSNRNSIVEAGMPGIKWPQQPGTAG